MVQSRVPPHERDPTGVSRDVRKAFPLPAEDEMYRALAARDPDANGGFVVAVRTTGVFCRPTCPSRTPLRGNVEFHPTSWDALAAGFRPCRRCRPMGDGARQLVVTRFATPLGTMVAAAVEEGIAVLEFADRRSLRTELRDVCRRLDATPTGGSHPHLDQLQAQLAEYFAGHPTSFDVQIVARGTRFEESVWSWLRTIPAGETRTYAQGATALGRPAATRAIGRANGANRLAIVIPCHRVIGSDGELTGYGGGLWRKQALLDLEAATV